MPTIFHGTTQEAAENILTFGLKARSCVTTDEGLASYYAETAAEESGPVEGVVLTLWVADAELMADVQALAEPVGWGGKTSKEIEHLITVDITPTLENSLLYCASARLTHAVSPQRITLL
jgi:hypothetical protein